MERFKKDDGGLGSEFKTKAHQIYVCDIDDRFGASSSISQTDDITKIKIGTTALNINMNEAQIFGQISFEVVNKVEFSCFYLASNYFSLLVNHTDFITIFSKYINGLTFFLG